MEDRLLGKKRYVLYKDPFLIVLIVLVLLLLLRIGFLSRYCLIYVVGDSMSPTLTGASKDGVSGGDYLYADTYAQPEHGDIVAAYVTRDDGTQDLLIKRVVACGGDTIRMEDGVVYIMYAGTDYYEVLEEDYVAQENNVNPSRNYFEPVRVPEGYYFLLGDNRDHSNDSRVYGCFSEDSVLGVITDWSLSAKSFFTAIYTFLNFGVIV